MKRFGWMRRWLCAALAVALLALSAMPALAVGQSSTLAKDGDVYIVTASSLNVRSGAGMAYAVETRIKRGTKVIYRAKDNGWWKVELPSGDTGYVDKQYLTRASQNTTTTYTTTARLKVHEKPRTSAKTLGTLKKGTKVTVLKLNGDWGRIKYKGKTGWIALKYLKKSY